MAKDRDFSKSEMTLITHGTVIEGTLSSEGNIRIDGTVNGKITVKGSLFIGSTGIINADIEAQKCSIAGKVIGKMNIAQDTVLEEGSFLKGDINTKELVINKKAVFNGLCDMGEFSTGVEGK